MYVMKKVKKPVSKDGNSQRLLESSSPAPSSPLGGPSDGKSGAASASKGSKQTTSSSSTVHGAPSSHICGCFATKHPFVSSCIGCGRIKCEAENKLHSCPACGTFLIKPMNAEGAAEHGFDAATVKAYQQKDKLLQFDKEHAKRTHVHDAQGDYYESGTWLSEEEKIAINRKEAARRKMMEQSQRRPNSVFAIDLKAGKLVSRAVNPEEIMAASSDAELVHDFQDTIVCGGPTLSKAASSAVSGESRNAGTSNNTSSSSSNNSSSSSSGASMLFSSPQQQDQKLEQLQQLQRHYAPVSRVENEILSQQQSKAGDVYRLIKNTKLGNSSGSGGGSGGKQSNLKSRKEKHTAGDENTASHKSNTPATGIAPQDTAEAYEEVRRFCRVQHDFDLF